MTLAAAATNADNPLTTAALIGGILSPFAAIGAAWMAAVYSRRTGREQTQTAARAVQVDEKEAHTAEIAMIIDGFTASLAAAQDDLRRKGDELTEARGELRQAAADLESANQRINDLRRRVVAYGKQLAEMLFHIMALERLVPNPPGPPARPDWEPWPADFDDTDNPNDPRRSP